MKNKNLKESQTHRKPKRFSILERSEGNEQVTSQFRGRGDRAAHHSDRASGRKDRRDLDHPYSDKYSRDEHGTSVTQFIRERNSNSGQVKTPVTHAYTDEELIRQIKEAIENEESIPAEDKNIAVTVEDMHVVLRGAVLTEQIKMTIGDKAVSFAGLGKVRNYLQYPEAEEETDQSFPTYES